MSRLPMNPLLAALGAMTSGDDEEERRRRENEAFQQRVAQDLQNFGQFQNLQQAKNDAAMALMERNRTYDPQVNADRRDTATNAMMQALADKYGPAFRDRQAGPMSDLNVDDRGQRLIALAEQNRTKGMSKDGKPIRMPGESAADYLARAREFMQRPANDPAEAKQRMEARKAELVKNEQGFRNQLGMAPFKAKNQELHKQSMEAAGKMRAELKGQKDAAMARRREMRQQKAVANNDMAAWNRMTRNMDPKDAGALFINMMKAQYDSQSDQQKNQIEREKLDTLNRQALADAVTKYREQYPGASVEQLLSYAGRLAPLYGVDPSAVNGQVQPGGSPTPNLGQPSDTPDDFRSLTAKADKLEKPEALLNAISTTADASSSLELAHKVLDKFEDGKATEQQVTQAVNSLSQRGVDVTDLLERVRDIQYQKNTKVPLPHPTASEYGFGYGSY